MAVDKSKLIAWLEIAGAVFAGGAGEAAEQALASGMPHDWAGWRRVLIVAGIAGVVAVWHRYRPVPVAPTPALSAADASKQTGSPS